MRTVLGLVMFALLLAAQAVAQQGPRALTTMDDGKPYLAVGRLEVGVERFCTATLIEPSIVLTAAHCVVDDATGRVHDAATIRFRAGLRDGRAEADRGAVSVAVPDDYVAGGTHATDLARDVALVRLDRPVDTQRIPAFAVGRATMPGSAVAVVSYAHDRAERPAIEERCEILGRSEGALLTTCEVDFGASGAPVLRYEGGRPTVVSVISATARVGARRVSVGSDFAGRLDVLRARIGAAAGRRIRTVSSHEARTMSSAKFLRP